MSVFDYQLSTISQYRAGTVDDPYVQISESKKVNNQVVILSEIPVALNKVQITGFTEKSQNDTTDLGINDYRVDYSEGLVHFNVNQEGKTLTLSYQGRGNHFLSVNRVWTNLDSKNNVAQTLGDIIKNAGTITSVTSSNTDIAIGTPNTTPVLTLNTGVGANQIGKRDANGNLQNIGYAATNVSANTTLTYAQSGIINVTTGASNITITLPDATTAQVVFTIKKADSGAGQVIINTTSSQTIDGVTSKTLVNQYADITVLSSAGIWLVDVDNFSDKIGLSLANLQTTDKSNLINAINEGRSKTVQQGTTLPPTPTEGTLFYLTADYTDTSGTLFKAKHTYQYNGANWKEFISGSQTVSTNSLSLAPGLQIINNDSDTKGSIDNVSMNGRTLVNLLGRDGNCEDVSKWTGYNGTTVALDSSNQKYGTNAIKYTSVVAGSQGLQKLATSIKANSYYVALADIKNGTTTSSLIQFAGTAGNTITGTSYGLSYVKLSSGASTTGDLFILSTGTSISQYAYVDGIRLYEITQTEYNALGTTLTDINQIAAKYPYVDDVKPVANPFIYKYGKNLLPPFTEWTLNGTSGVDTVIEPYKLQKVATANFQGTAVSVPAIPNQTYTLQFTRAVASAFMNITYTYTDGTTSGEIINTASSSTLSFSFTTPSNVKTINVGCTNNATGTFTYNNPMLNLGSTIQPFESRNDDYLFLSNLSLHSSTDGTVYDSLFTRDNQFRKLKRYTDVSLDGSLGYTFTTDYTGFKMVKCTSFTNYKTLIDIKAIKYDGKILGIWNSTSYIDEAFTENDSSGVEITVADTDSGWGETYTPSAAEIQSYFWGYRMNNGTFGTPYNGTGTKTWTSMLATSNTGSVTIVPTTPSADIANKATTYYRLVYQLATSVEEPATSEGQISLSPGLNQIEVGAGVIVRELVNPDTHSDGFTRINNNTSGRTTSFLKNRAAKVLNVYRGETNDLMWTKIVNPANTAQYGIAHAFIPTAQYDQTQAYEVTYLALDTYLLGTTPQTISAQIGKEALAVIQKNVQDIADLTTRVDVITNTYARRDMPPWITPTLLNGWVNFGGSQTTVGYYKDDLGNVHLRGMIKNGTGTASTKLFILPVGYRPSLNQIKQGASFNGTSISLTCIDIVQDGSVQINGNTTANTTWMNIDEITFRAEQ